MLDPAIGKRISAFLVTVALTVPLLTGTALAETVRIWTFLNPDGKAGREQVLKTLISNFEAAHPGTKIEVEPQNYQTMVDKFYAAHQTKTAPDVMFIYTSRLFDGIKIGAFANLNELFVKNWSAEDVADVDGAFWRYGATPTARYQVTIEPVTSSPVCFSRATPVIVSSPSEIVAFHRPVTSDAPAFAAADANNNRHRNARAFIRASSRARPVGQIKALR